jgi:hypothetical protein
MAVPFPRFALARFVPGREAVQGVTWDGVQGFDQTVMVQALRDAGDARFYVLDFPSALALRTTRGEVPDSVPRVLRSAHGGERIPVVDLDTLLPGNVAAAFVFPANERALELFERTRGTEMDPTLHRLFAGYENFSMGRWVRPENIEVIERLARR